VTGSDQPVSSRTMSFGYAEGLDLVRGRPTRKGICASLSATSSALTTLYRPPEAQGTRWPTPGRPGRGDPLDAIGVIRDLRGRDGKALQVMGSASLAAQLITHGLVDEYRLMIEPILLGGGKRLFPDDSQARALELVAATTTATGVLICTYRPADR
jgi:riboflavin biosynthesis pyrimidine reductase